MDPTFALDITDDGLLDKHGKTTSDTAVALADANAARQHNAALPIHSLPAEIFLDILFMSIDLTKLQLPLIPQLYALAQVSMHWLYSIRSNPRFWSLISFDECDWVSTVLKKNPTGPLIVRCGSWHRPSPDNVVEFLQLACQHAYRWEKVMLNAALDLALLKVHAPILKHLELGNYDSQATHTLRISAPALKQLRLSYIPLPLNTHSLIGLKILMIRYRSTLLPSLTQLLGVLKASPELEWFGLEESFDRTVFSDDLDTSELSGPILLPVLRGLWLKITNHSALCHWIDAPNCAFFDGDMLFDVLTQPGSTAAKFATMPSREPLKIELYFFRTGIEFDLTTSTQYPCNLFPYAHPQSIRVSDMPNEIEGWRLLMETLGLSVEGRTQALELFLDHGPTVFSGDQIGFWRSASYITFNQEYPHVLRALKFLGKLEAMDGVASWNCPRLRTIEFNKSRNTHWEPDQWSHGVTFQALADGVLDLLSKRAGPLDLVVLPAWDEELEVSTLVEKIRGPIKLIEKLKGKVPVGIVLNEV